MNIEIKNYLNFKKKKTKISKKKFDEIKKNLSSTKEILNNILPDYQYSFKKNQLVKFKKFKNIIIIGMGGSILGTKSIYSFFKNRIKKNIFFLDNLDEVKIKEVRKNNKFNKNLYIIVSKSGNTIETLSIVNLFKKNNINKSNTIIITENKNNELNNFALINKITRFSHNEYIGGRYSVLSEVGMIPSYLMNLKIDKFKRNIKKNIFGNKKPMTTQYISEIADFFNATNKKTLVLINYSPYLSDFCYWLQQLIAESLGKKNKGLIPLVSNCPKDHHSLLQLYLDGPKDKFFYVFNGTSLINMKLNKNRFSKTFSFLSNKKIEKSIKAQQVSLTNVFKKNKISFREIHINNHNEEVLGELFAFFMVETVLIGKIIKVNPFNQPAVEEVKKITRKILKKSTK